MNPDSIVSLLKNIGQVKQERKEAETNLAVFDKRINDLYHVLEFEKLDAPAMMRLCKELKNSLTGRRKCKNYLRYYQSIVDSLPDMDQKLEKVMDKELKDMLSYSLESSEARKRLKI
jgi:hypothetical protein